MAHPVIASLSARLDALERKVLGRARRRISRKEKARLMGVTPRTIARHVAAGLLEPPDIENGRWYFWIDEPEPEPPRSGSGAADTAAARAARNPRLRKPAHTSS